MEAENRAGFFQHESVVDGYALFFRSGMEVFYGKVCNGAGCGDDK